MDTKEVKPLFRYCSDSNLGPPLATVVHEGQVLCTPKEVMKWRIEKWQEIWPRIKVGQLKALVATLQLHIQQSEEEAIPRMDRPTLQKALKTFDKNTATSSYQWAPPELLQATADSQEAYLDLLEDIFKEGESFPRGDNLLFWKCRV